MTGAAAAAGAQTPRPGTLRCLSPGGFHSMSYREFGAPGAARVVICVHGLTRNGRDFDTLAAALAEAGFRVVCPDIVGRGESSWLSDPAGYAFPQYLADMTVLLARLEADVVDWVGTSMGGLIGMTMAAQSSTAQSGTPLRRLVLNDVGPFLPKAALARIGAYSYALATRFNGFYPETFVEVHDAPPACEP